MEFSLEVPVLRQTWPKRQDLSLQEAAARLGRGEALSDLSAQWQALMALRKAATPLIGVVGQLNAGKSSLVRSFLSEQGAGRTLAGLDEREATQRFVFWLPASWQENASILEALEEELESIFGASREYLDEDPARAHRQYNGDDAVAENFATPLVAFDPRLDELGFGLLDCPDFERRHPGVHGLDTARVRRQFMRRAARMMSAVAVVAARACIANEKMTFLLDPELGLAGRPLFLLINTVRPRDPVHGLLQDEAVRRVMSSLNVDTIFAAYDSNMDGAAQMIPLVEADHRRTDDPVFFQVDPDPAGNRAEAVGRDRLIQARLGALAPQDLWKMRRAAGVEAMLRDVGRLRQDISAETGRRNAEVMLVRAGIMDFVREVCAPDGNLRFPVTPMIARQLSEAVMDAAPAWARPTIWMTRAPKALSSALRRTWQWTSQKYRVIADPLQEAGRQAREISHRIRATEGEAYFHARTLSEQVRRRRFMPEGLDEALLQQAWDAALRETGSLHANLPENELHQFGGAVWDSVSMSRKISLVALGPVLFLGAAVTACAAPFDLGGSAVFFAASVTELLAVLGIGVAGGKTAELVLNRMLLHNVAVPAYARLLTAGLDVFHLPRPEQQSLEDRFDNLGHVSLDVSPAANPVLPAILPLVPDAAMGEEVPGGWERILERVQQGEGDAS